MITRNAVRVIGRCFCLTQTEKSFRRFSTTTPDITSYTTIRKYIQLVKDPSFPAEQPLKVEMNNTALMKALQGVWSPVCVTGKYKAERYRNEEFLLKKTTIHDVHVKELIEAAKQLSVTKKPSSSQCLEIDGSWLYQRLARDVGQACYDSSLVKHFTDQTLVLSKLIIQNPNTDLTTVPLLYPPTLRKGFVGTMLFHLNSAYTGGEIRIVNGEHTEVVAGPYSWAALRPDCAYSLDPVTSGARVCLMYHIYGTPTVEESSPKITPVSAADEGYDTDAESKRSRQRFWEDENDYVIEMNERYNFDAVKWHNSAKARPAAITCADKLVLPLAQNVTSAMLSELEKRDTIVIGLQNLYPECQTSPAFLKGGDRALYDLLSEQFDVRVVAATIHRDDWIVPRANTAALYSADIVNNALKAEQGRRAVPSTIKLVLPNQLQEEQVLEHFEADRRNRSVYLVSGLKVTSRASKSKTAKGVCW